MPRMKSVAHATYILGWISLLAAVLLRLLLLAGVGIAFEISARVMIPHSLLELSVVLFLASIASDIRERAGNA